jgi:hypothetical protein
MKEEMKYLYSKEAQQLQLPYEEYKSLVEKAREGQKLLKLKETVLSNLQAVMGGSSAVAIDDVEKKIADRITPPKKPVEPTPVEVEEVVIKEAEPAIAQDDDAEETATKKVAIEFSPDDTANAKDPSESIDPVAMRPSVSAEDLPPIKEDIARLFNSMDDSGRLFNVFTQYYIFLNDLCGSTVRVTMKDGVCSFWNYDAWEEFAFVDIFEDNLRIAVDPSHTDKLKALQICEVPRLLSMRRNLTCVKVDDLNKTVLDVLAKAFSEVEAAAG